MVDLTELDSATGEVWDALLDLAAKKSQGWTLIGAQMVALCGWEHGRVTPRATTDADVLVNARVARQGTTRLSRLLVDSGYRLEGVDTFGVGHRFSNGRVRIDVLAPDGLTRGKTRLVTVPPARTICVPGGTQALARTRPVDVRRASRTGRIPCPDLLGAILIKARAVEVDDVPESQLSDLAFLLGLVEDPRQLAKGFRGKERSWLRRHRELMDRNHRAWRGLADQDADNGHIAFRIMTGLWNPLLAPATETRRPTRTGLKD